MESEKLVYCKEDLLKFVSPGAAAAYYRIDKWDLSRGLEVFGEFYSSKIKKTFVYLEKSQATQVPHQEVITELFVEGGAENWKT